MTQHRLTIFSAALLLLLGCAGSPVSNAPTGAQSPVAPVAAEPFAPVARRDLVSTLPGPKGYSRDMFFDAHNRMYVVTDQAIARVDGDGRSVPIATSHLPLDASREQMEREFYYPLTGSVAPDGTIYGLGLLSRLYKVSPDGRTLASYAIPGANYLSGADLATDSKGNVYVTVSAPDYGPDHPPHAWIAKLTPAGELTPLAGDPDGPVGYQDGPGAAARFDTPTSLAVDAFDNLYVAELGNMSIRRITPEGVVSTVAGKGRPQLPPSPMPGLPSPDLAPYFEGTVPVVALTVDRAGDLFYATSDNRIWRVSPDGDASWLAGSGRICQGPMACPAAGSCPPPPPPDACYVDGPGALAEFNGILALAASREGTLYALDGRTNGTRTLIRRIDWPEAPDASVVRPGPLAVRSMRSAPPPVPPSPSPTPNLPITVPSCAPGLGCPETAGRVYDAEGHPVSSPLEVWAAIAGQPGTATRVGTATAGRFRILTPRADLPLDLVVRGPGFGSRRRSLSVRAYRNDFGYGPTPPYEPTELNFGGQATSADPDAPAYFLPEAGRDLGYVQPGPLTTFESSTVTTVAGTGRDETFAYVAGLAVRPDGTVLATSSQRNTLLSIAPSGQTTVLAGGPYEVSEDQYLVDGQGAAAHFFSPSGVAIAPDGMAYVADSSNAAIRKVTPAGTVSTLAGHRVAGYADGIGAAARFRGPSAVAVDRAGTVYVADSGNHCIRAIGPTGDVTTFAGADTPGWANGFRTAARFRSPSDLAFGPDGSLYVADSGNYRFRRIAPDGRVSDVYGGVAIGPDGTAQLPALSQASHLAVDSRGNLVTGQSERVFRIRPTGDVTILAGYGLWGFADGDARHAYFAGIQGLSIGPDDAVYVSEYGNLRIRKIVPE